MWMEKQPVYFFSKGIFFSSGSPLTADGLKINVYLSSQKMPVWLMKVTFYPWLFLSIKVLNNQINLRWADDSLVHASVVFLVSGKAEHAADNLAVHMIPVIVAELLPLAFILHLHVALGHRDALTIRWQDGTYTDILHLNVHALRGERIQRVILFLMDTVNIIFLIRNTLSVTLYFLFRLFLKTPKFPFEPCQHF